MTRLKLSIATLACVLMLPLASAQAEQENNKLERHAPEDGRGFGFGAEMGFGTIFGSPGSLGALAAVYDFGKFYVQGLATVTVTDNGPPDAFGGGARFYYILNQRQRADFAVGGGVGLIATNAIGNNTNLGIVIDGGFQTRIFIVPAVSFNLTAGLVAQVIDGGSFFSSTGRLTGAAGFTYFF